jgi:hypothetical protein
MSSAGIDLRPSLHTRKLMVQTALPEALGSDSHLFRAIEATSALGSSKTHAELRLVEPVRVKRR